ncbi:MAG: HDIG domain-containing metalloprotein [Spirulinaceae cyanobacterium]
MGKFHSIKEKVHYWQQKHQVKVPFLLPAFTNRKVSLSQPQSSSVKKRKLSAEGPLVFVVTVISLTGVVGQRFYNQPELAVGTIAPQTITAPFYAQVEDPETTQEERKAARTGVVPVLKINEEVTNKINQDLENTFRSIDEMRQLTDSFTLIDEEILSLPMQRRLGSSKEEEWQSVLVAVREAAPKRSSDQVLKPALRQSIRELKDYQQQVSSAEFSELLVKISQVRKNYAQGKEKILENRESELINLIADYEDTLIELGDQTWRETKSGIRRVSERILAQGIAPGLPEELVVSAVSQQIDPLVPVLTLPLATELLINTLEPNLIEDEEQTRREAEQAVLNIKSKPFPVRQGEVIVEEGEEITQEDFVLLDHFGLSRRSPNWMGLIGCAVVLTGATGIFVFVQKKANIRLRSRDGILICLLSLTTPLTLIFFSPRYNNLAAIGLLTSSFYNPALGVTQVILLTGASASSIMGVNGTVISWEYLLAGAAGGIVAAIVAGSMRSREEMAALGGAVGLTLGFVCLFIILIRSATAGTIWYPVLQDSVLYGFFGVAWSIIALGISPYLERVFDLITLIRLVELSNPNRPLLKRLATETPGTFQHTLFVASLAEAGTRELQCNVELVRAGTLYHDIGKMHDPQGFIENQMGGPNKHDEINDPVKSAVIIKKHVSEGIVLAKKHGLPKAIRDFIPEHQGTLLISYFYFQARQRAEQEEGCPVKEEDFRYNGPIPQSKETGIMMLADGCEAALRSLKDITPDAALMVVNKIMRARWQDGQLADSGLTREELARVAKVFVRVWQQFNHQRIAYPKAALEMKPMAK